MDTPSPMYGSRWMNAASDLEAALEVTNVLDEYYYLTTFEAIRN